MMIRTALFATAVFAAGCAVQPIERTEVAPVMATAAQPVVVEDEQSAVVGYILPLPAGSRPDMIPPRSTEPRYIGTLDPVGGVPVITPQPQPASPDLIPGATGPMPRPEDWVPPLEEESTAGELR